MSVVVVQEPHYPLALHDGELQGVRIACEPIVFGNGHVTSLTQCQCQPTTPHPKHPVARAPAECCESPWISSGEGASAWLTAQQRDAAREVAHLGTCRHQNDIGTSDVLRHQKRKEESVVLRIRTHGAAWGRTDR